MDYPIYHEVPKTSFSCAKVPAVPGMYANVETGCQVSITEIHVWNTCYIIPFFDCRHTTHVMMDVKATKGLLSCAQMVLCTIRKNSPAIGGTTLNVKKLSAITT